MTEVLDERLQIRRLGERIPEPAGRSQILAIVATVATVVVGAIGLASQTIWPAVGVAFVILLLAVAARLGYLLGSALSIVITFSVLLVGLLTSAWVHAPIVSVVISAVVAAGLLGCGVLARSRPRALRRPGSTWRDLAGASVGLIVWLIALLASLRVPLTERLGWMMRGDSMNNLIFSHVDLRAGGIQLGGDLNPTPLPAGLVALGLVAGRGSGQVQLNLVHDLAGMELVWFGLIALTTVLFGVTSTALVRAAVGPGRASTLAGAAGSLLVLSWYVTGQSLEFGFINLDVVLPILLASLLIAMRADRAPWAAVAGLGLASTLVMSVWTPLVVIPLGLLLVTLVRDRGAIRHAGPVRLTLIGLSASQFVAYAALGAIPAFVQQQGALSAQGGIYSPSGFGVFVLGAGVIALAVLGFRRSMPTLLSMVTVVVAAWIALGVLLVITHGVFTYYPLKLTLFSDVVFLMLGLAGSVAVIARPTGRRGLRWLGAAIVAVGLVTLLAATPRLGIASAQYNPVVRIVASHPNEAARSDDDTILRLAARTAPTIIWDTGRLSEPQIDLWLLQLHANTLSGSSALRLAAYAQQADHSPIELCRIARMVGPRLVVLTTSAELSSKLTRACPRVPISVRVSAEATD